MKLLDYFLYEFNMERRYILRGGADGGGADGGGAAEYSDYFPVKMKIGIATNNYIVEFDNAELNMEWYIIFGSFKVKFDITTEHNDLDRYLNDLGPDDSLKDFKLFLRKRIEDFPAGNLTLSYIEMEYKQNNVFIGKGLINYNTSIYFELTCEENTEVALFHYMFRNALDISKGVWMKKLSYSTNSNPVRKRKFVLSNIGNSSALVWIPSEGKRKHEILRLGLVHKKKKIKGLIIDSSDRDPLWVNIKEGKFVETERDGLKIVNLKITLMMKANSELEAKNWRRILILWKYYSAQLIEKIHIHLQKTDEFLMDDYDEYDKDPIYLRRNILNINYNHIPYTYYVPTPFARLELFTTGNSISFISLLKSFGG